MNRLLLYIVVGMVVAITSSCSKLPPSNEIWYTTTDGEPIPIYYSDKFDATVVSNTYRFGQGVIRFDKKVTKIKSFAFGDEETLRSLTIPDSITDIEGGAVSGCESLMAFYGKYASPDSRCLIADGNLVAFAPFGLSEYTIPENVAKIDNRAFYRSNGALEAFYGKYASSDNRSLIVDGELVAFASCGLAEYTIPDEVTKIGKLAFSECKKITSVSIPDSVTEICTGAFWRCELLGNVTIGKNLKKIGPGAFEDCYGLRNVEIPSSVTEIGNGAFSGCCQLRNIDIPWGVLEIPQEAFRGCRELRDIHIPSCIKKIGNQAFAGCSRLTNIEIPYSVIEIGWGAFSGCLRLEKVLIGIGVTKINSRTFDECKRLKDIEIGFNVTSIGEHAFADCESLNIVNIPTNVTEIGEYAFYNCKGLHYLIIGKGVKTIGEKAFWRWSANHKMYVFCTPITPPKGAERLFDAINTIYVPYNSVEMYKSAEYWSDYGYYIKGDDI